MQMQKARFEPVQVIGLTRGGLIPAVILSHMYNDIPVIPISYSSTDGAGDNKNHNNELPTIAQINTLIIDDIADSGRTLHEVSSYYMHQGASVQTASLYYKEGSMIQPNFFWQEILHG